MPYLGISAIRSMTRFLQKVEKELYPELERRKTAMPVIPEGSRRSTLNFNSIHGGQVERDRSVNAAPSPVVADSCRLMLDRRYLIEEDPVDVKREIVTCWRPASASTTTSSTGSATCCNSRRT